MNPLRLLLTTTMVITPGMALAQAAVPSPVAPIVADETPDPGRQPEPDDGAETPDITVTGSRLASRGFLQPTPTTTLGRDDLEKLAQPNIFQAIRLLPALQGSSGRQTRGNSTSSGQQGLSSFALRGLGEVRTLTLLDGQRFTPANFIGVADISQFPQLLIERVDVVTGGASASYGSDAVGGVVNFITSKRFKGLRANFQTGITSYGDDKNATAQLAWGGASADDRFHVQLSGEYSFEGGTGPGDFGVAGGINGRDWYNAPEFLDRGNAATVDGRPRLTQIRGAQPYQYAKYGLITSGPLQGIAFGPNGTPYQFQYGSGGRPLGNGLVSGCFSPYCVGGDLSGQIGQSPSLASRLERFVGYGRIGYELFDDVELFATFTRARVLSRNTPNRGAERTGLAVQCDNAFLPVSIRSACAANGITSFRFGTSSGQFPDPITVRTRRDQQRYVLGLDGKSDLAGTQWHYTAYGAHGVSDIAVDVSNITLQARFNAAIDAIAGPNGTVICRSAIARASGCVPFNAFGDVTNTAAAYDYVMPRNGPRQRSRQEQNVFNFNVTGEPLSSWAGPVAIAFGVEGREEIYRTVADPYGAGVNDATPNSDFYPADPLLNTVIGNNWYAGNYKAGRGRYGVKEAYAEINVPILQSDQLGTANINGAFRLTDYSTSGTVHAWKIGGVWKTPLDGLRLRAVTSRDVRAPNLSELFAAQIVTNSTVQYRNTTINIQSRVSGNLNLTPEIGRSTELGVVYTEPSWLPGLALSVDYYKINVNDAITSLSAQQIVDLCDQGVQEQCAATLLNSPVPGTNFVQVSAFNAASIKTDGIDIEASYRFPLSGIGVPGRITLRGLATHVFKLVTTSAVVGSIPIDAAGNNRGAVPNWKGLLTQSWDADGIGLSLTERFISAGVYSNEWIECRTGCPVSTNNNPTVDDNSMPGAFYVDVGGSYDVTRQLTAYFRVDNVLNTNPVASPGSGIGPGINPLLYDILGRTFRVGLRANF